RSTYEALRRQADDGDILPLLTPELLSDVAAGLLEMGARVVGLKLGDRGFYLRTGTAAALADMGRGRPAQPAAWADRELWAPCFRARFVGATGSGDATIAGFLAGLWRGLSAEEAVTAAVAVGACNVEAADTLSGLRPWEETMARVAAGWERHPLVLTAPGWEWLPDRGLWRRLL
ncbi:MAG: PfkB family carbohydrate kinase, partial [Anaerolineae bacterium]|nr:PfkB family carbohydrate kinase [Caldilineales bacterium]MDW8270040.1 PfkB family carbohydrate kinase [Anaerolineae bacterium]